MTPQIGSACQGKPARTPRNGSIIEQTIDAPAKQVVGLLDHIRP